MLNVCSHYRPLGSGPRAPRLLASLNPAFLHGTLNYKLPMKVQIMKRVFTGAGLSIHVEPVAWVALAVEGARGADTAVLAAVLPPHAHVHPCKTEWISVAHRHTRHMGTQLWLLPCPCSRSQRDHPHSPSAHPLIPSAQTLCSALSWHLTGEVAAPSALLLARAATPSTPLKITFRHRGPLCRSAAAALTHHKACPGTAWQTAG